MKADAGIITVDFLFALALAMAMFSVLFAMSFTLTMVEITQYVVYSAARAQAAGNASPSDQRDRALSKYKQLVETKTSTLFPLFSNGWFSIGKSSDLDIRQGSGVSGGKDFSNDLAAGHDTRHQFMGVSTKFVSNILHLKLPLLGEIGESGGFATFVNGIMIREPAMSECLNFFEARRQQLKSLSSGSSFYEPEAYVRMEDNGC